MNYSYVTLLSNDSYLFGVILLNKSLKDTNAQYPLVVLATTDVSKPVLNILEQLGLKYKTVEPIQSDEMLQYNMTINNIFAKTWYSCLTKFELFNMIEYEKIVYLDADILVLKNLDHLFKCPHLTSALDGEYFNIWPDDPHFNAGIMVIEPNIEEYQKIMDFTTTEALTHWNKLQCIADQEILNMYFNDWNNNTNLHLNKYYDIFAPYIQEEQIDDIKENCYFIHYVGRKPWRAFSKNTEETYTEYFYDQAHQIIQEEVNKLDWKQAKSKIKIAVYGICKDEMVNADKYVECFSQADYLCLLDTGSTDGTWEHLQELQQKYTNLIIDQQIIEPWRYDTARNISLKLVPKDTTIYFMVDLDEIVKDENWPNLIREAWSPLMLRGSYTYNRRIDEVTNAIIQQFQEYRLHTNAWHYEGIVHEQLCDVCGNRQFFVDECIEVPMTVWHYPNNPNREIYIELCERGVEENPTNWVMHLQLAAEYEVHHKYDQAINEYRRIIVEQNGLSDLELGRCYASLGRILGLLDKKEEALNIFKKGRELLPQCGDNYFLAAEITYAQQKYEETYNLCDEGLKQAIDNQWCTIMARESYFPYLLMGLSKYFLGELKEGFIYLTIAREKNKTEDIDRLFYLLMTEIINGR